jgi:hypothetical protein
MIISQEAKGSIKMKRTIPEEGYPAQRPAEERRKDLHQAQYCWNIASITTMQEDDVFL